MKKIALLVLFLVVFFFALISAINESWFLFFFSVGIIISVVQTIDKIQKNEKSHTSVAEKSFASRPIKQPVKLSEKQKETEKEIKKGYLPINIKIQQKNRKNSYIQMLMIKAGEEMAQFESEPFGNAIDAVDFARWFRNDTNINATVYRDSKIENAYIVRTDACYNYHLPWGKYFSREDVWRFPNPKSGMFDVFDELIDIDEYEPTTEDETIALYIARRLSEGNTLKLVMISPQTNDMPPLIYITNKNDTTAVIYAVEEDSPLRTHHINLVIAAKEIYKTDHATIATNTTLTPTAKILAESKGIEAIEEIEEIQTGELPQNTKLTGEDYEKYVADKLKSKGFTKVSLTPKSGDFGADIIAFDGNRKFCFQCKYYSGSVGIAAIQEVMGAKAYYGCDVAVVVTNSKLTQSAKELANKSGVMLMENFT